MQYFRCQTKIQQATFEFIVSHISTNEEVKNLKEIFVALDANGDGKISTEELIIALDESSTLVRRKSTEIISRCDSDHSGYIDYTEFLSASMD